MGRLYERVAAALLWTAAFAFATGLFFSITLLLSGLPPTAPVAVGLVTIERYSKLKDYLSVALFFVTVPPLTVWFRHLGARLLAREQRRFDARRAMPVAMLFTLPFFLSPFFYLTTGKVGWIVLLPVALAYGGVRALHAFDTTSWLRRLFRRELYPYHALLFCEALAWIIFRYLVTIRRIAHYPTLLLEVVFVAVFLALFWGVAVLVSRLAELSFGADGDDVFRRVACGALPIVLLPLVATVRVPTPAPSLLVAGALLLSAVLALAIPKPIAPRRAWGVAAYLIIPALIYCFSYASSAQPSQAIDLFHRGESIGPASDYLRGKAPYTEVFALHGMLEDGLLDAWLMMLFGRSVDVAIARSVIVGAFLAVSIWYLGIAIFQSIPLAMLVVAMGSWTTAENNRTFFQVAAVTLLWIALSRHSRAAAIGSGVFAAIALFFSYEIGLYTIAGALVSIVVCGRLARTRPIDAGGTPALLFALGLFLGAAPFIAYLAAKGALGAFAQTSFITIPRIIDAVWSMPFPDLVTMFRKDLNLNTLADFVLREKFHLVLSPLTIAISATYLIQRAVRRRVDTLDAALLVLTVFAGITQRTAFGRAEFRHQYFAAFLIGPMLVVLAVLIVRRLREMWDVDAARPFIVTLVAAALPVIAVLFWIPDLVNTRIDDLVRYQVRVLRLHRDAQAEEVAFRIDAVSQAVRELTRPGQPMFDFSNQPAFYFFADRPNPTRFYQIPILSPRELQRETIVALERTKPAVVIRRSPENYDTFDGIDNDVRAQAVSSYINDYYSYHRTVRGVEIWRRKPQQRAVDVNAYLRRIRIPLAEEIAAAGTRSRLVFPTAGSVPGANQSYWRSDLTLHNPHKEALALNLRYVAGDVRIDRAVVLAGGRSVRWEDVVRSFFGAPEGRGAIWLEYRGARPPVARLRTYDAAHDAKASIDAPLSMRDAATRGDLTIVGIPGGGLARRVNVGIVNVGLIPATFRITAQTRTGQTIGRSFEEGLPEDESKLVSDIETVLGVQLDDTTTLHITPVAGTIVAYATVVGVNGDSQFLSGVP
ncbi:MAG: hypothetical protein AABO58_18100 [Acidobacteriota bacterium]